MAFRHLLLAALALTLLACEGALVGPRVERPVDPNLPEGAPRELPSPSSRTPRLSRAEYENVVQDLFGASAPLGITEHFVPDSTSGTFDNAGGELNVTSPQWTDYQTAAEELAKRATVDVSTLSKVAGGPLPTDSRALVAALGRRLFRRSLDGAEIAAHVALYDEGATYYPTQGVQLAGARLVLEAMFQSPHFLYRPELSTAVASDVIPLSGPELASRLSFALWQSMPDVTLLDAAESGALLTTEGYTAQVTRLLADPRARSASQAFHAQLLEQSKYADVTRSLTLFPNFSVELRESMKQEQVRFLDDVLFTRQGNLAALLTTKASYVDARLAKIYGLQGTFGAEYQRVEFTDSRRAGLFTQVGFLAAHASATESDPIHRGVFINRKVLCAPLPAPPNGVPPLPRGDPNVPQTLRQRVTAYTGAGTCGAGCHGTMINPAGFAYEHFDALGAWREQDNGLPVDAADTYVFDFTTPRSYDGAVQLGEVMASESMAHDCYAQHWQEFLHGRTLTDADATVVKRVGKRSLAEGTPVTSLLGLLVESEAFKTRAVEVSP